MAKRFTCTQLWEEDWFIEMPPDYQFFWVYLKDNCDHAGIWKPNLSKFKKLYSRDIDLTKAIDLINSGKERVIILPNGRWFLTGFIPFQYGSVLNTNSRVHTSIISLLTVNEVKLTSIRPLIEVMDRVKDKDKDKDKDIITDDGGVGEEETPDPMKKEALFSSLWEKYPKRDGRKSALKSFIGSVKTKEDWDAINIALENYLQSDTVLKGFIKNGSTWFNNWKDWVKNDNL